MLGSLLAVIRHNADGMLIVDPSGVILLVNPAAEELLGRSGTALGGKPFGAPLATDSATEVDIVSGGTARTAEMRVVDLKWHDAPAFLVTLHDVTDRKRTEQLLVRGAEQHAALALLGRDAVSGLMPDVLMSRAARHVQRVLGTDFAGVLAVSPASSGELRLECAEWAEVPLDPFSCTPAEGSLPLYALAAVSPVVMRDEDDQQRFTAWPPGFASAISIPLGEHGRPFGVIEAASLSPRRFDEDEVTFLQSVASLLAAARARAQSEDRVRHQSLHDPLTGLPNRALFVDRLEHSLARSRRRTTGLAVLFADLDGFKLVNDTLGHHAGDEVLVSVARRLAETLRSSDTLARFGGDEFVILLEGVTGAEELQQAVDRVRRAMTSAPFVVEGQEHVLDLTIGVVQADDVHESPDDLIRDADAAMYRAKDQGRGSYAVFDREMRRHAGERSLVERELRVAVAAGQMRLLYQPIISLTDGRIVELEALLRWEHPERGLLGPIDFLDVAVESRLIVPIGAWALGEACRQAAGWHAAAGSLAPSINVNLAASELAQPQLRETVRAAMDQYDGVTLQLELTEGAMIEDPRLPATLREMSDEMGVRIALDDFGTGYSSLAYLARFRVDELKVDRAFIHELADGRNSPIVEAIVNMAHALDVLVVAEGVETEEQACCARDLGCDRAQGFFFARPMPANAVGGLIGLPMVLPA